VLPIAQGGDGGDATASAAGEGDQALEIGAPIADVADQRHHVRALAREVREGRPGGTADSAQQMDVGDAGDAEALEVGRQAGHGDVVPGDLDGRRLDEEPVAERGKSEGAGGEADELAAGEGNRHRGKLLSAWWVVCGVRLLSVRGGRPSCAAGYHT